MVIISKKRILLVLVILGVSVLIFKITNSVYKNNIETVALPVSNKVVVIDAGHGYPDEGCSLLNQVKNRSNYFFIKNN